MPDEPARPAGCEVEVAVAAVIKLSYVVFIMPI